MDFVDPTSYHHWNRVEANIFHALNHRPTYARRIHDESSIKIGLFIHELSHTRIDRLIARVQRAAIQQCTMEVVADLPQSAKRGMVMRLSEIDAQCRVVHLSCLGSFTSAP